MIKSPNSILGFIVGSFCLLLTVSVAAQNPSPPSDSYFRAIISDASRLSGVVSDFTIERIFDTEKSAAYARLDGNGNRIVGVNDAYCIALNPQTVGDWPWRFAISHEIGHFQNGHVKGSILGNIWYGLVNGSQRELQADYFGGYVLGLMGATEAEALSFFTQTGLDFSTPVFSIYPPVNDRKAKTSEGWNQAIAQRAAFQQTQPGGNSGSSTATNPAVSATCATDNTGDYCFDNQTTSKQSVIIVRNGMQFKQTTVLPGQTKCLYSLPTEVYYYVVRDDRSRNHDDGDIIVEKCKSKSHVIR